MPQTLSAKRALRKDRRREAVNRLIRQKTKKAVKLMRQKPTNKAFVEAASLLDQAAKKSVIHHRTADRLKSRLARLLTKKEPSTPQIKPQKKRTKK